MKKDRLILVTNDDGITAPGIQALIEAVKDLGEIFVVAPDKPQSGMSHAITLSSTLRVHQVKLQSGVTGFSTNGTPVDCVKLAMQKVLPRKPDLIVSGINHGYNSSISVIYSGTMSAAIEGALEEVPAIGFSLGSYSIDADFSAATVFAREITRTALNEVFPEGICLNVNIPPVKKDEIAGIKVCRQAMACWKEYFDERTDPYGRKYYWLTGEMVLKEKAEDTDEYALSENYVSIVPVQVDMTAHKLISTIRKWNYEI